MGRKLVLTGTKLTDLTAPKIVTIDRMEAPGSLILVDPAHPAGPWASGLYADAAVVPNLFAANAVAVAGAGADVLKMGRGADWGTSKGMLERSGKGGLHAVPSPTLATSAGGKLYITAADALEAYLLANPTHQYFFSSWSRTTKAAAAAGASNNIIYSSAANATPGANYLAYAHFNGTTGAAGTARQGTNVTGPRISNTAPAAWTGTRAADAASMFTTIFSAVNTSWAFSDTKVRELGASVHYRFYLEDLTVSGRSYAEADAIDFAEYTKHVLTAGGRYYGDTYTNPTTIA